MLPLMIAVEPAKPRLNAVDIIGHRETKPWGSVQLFRAWTPIGPTNRGERRVMMGTSSIRTQLELAMGCLGAVSGGAVHAFHLSYRILTRLHPKQSGTASPPRENARAPSAKMAALGKQRALKRR